MEHHHPKCKHTAASPLCLLKTALQTTKYPKNEHPKRCYQPVITRNSCISSFQLLFFRPLVFPRRNPLSPALRATTPLVPPLYLRCTSVPPPFHLRSTSESPVVVERRGNGGRTEVLGGYQREALDYGAIPLTHHAPRTIRSSPQGEPGGFLPRATLSAERQTVMTAIQAGVCGYVHKGGGYRELVSALHDRPLTKGQGNGEGNTGLDNSLRVRGRSGRNLCVSAPLRRGVDSIAFIRITAANLRFAAATPTASDSPGG